MKSFSLFICFFYGCTMFLFAQTQSLSDVVVAGQKTTIDGMLNAEIILKRRQAMLIEQLKKSEAKYSNKRSALGNLSNGPVYMTLVMLMTSMEDKIKKVEYNIDLREKATFGFRHGLGEYKFRLRREKDYFLKLKKEFGILNECFLVSGGSGYNYISILKLLMEVMKVRQNILEVDMKVKNLMGVSALFAK